jgi:hypothetical protein
MSELALSPSLAETGRLAALRRAAMRTGGALVLALAGARVWFR